MKRGKLKLLALLLIAVSAQAVYVRPAVARAKLQALACSSSKCHDNAPKQPPCCCYTAPHGDDPVGLTATELPSPPVHCGLLPLSSAQPLAPDVCFVPAIHVHRLSRGAPIFLLDRSLQL